MNLMATNVATATSAEQTNMMLLYSVEAALLHPNSSRLNGETNLHIQQWYCEWHWHNTVHQRLLVGSVGICYCLGKLHPWDWSSYSSKQFWLSKLTVQTCIVYKDHTVQPIQFTTIRSVYNCSIMPAVDTSCPVIRAICVVVQMAWKRAQWRCACRYARQFSVQQAKPHMEHSNCKEL